MLTASYQIRAVTNAAGCHRSEQCDFQQLSESTRRGSSYHSLSHQYRLLVRPLWILLELGILVVQDFMSLQMVCYICVSVPCRFSVAVLMECILIKMTWKFS